jgi:hypothetical protein
MELYEKIDQLNKVRSERIALQRIRTNQMQFMMRLVNTRISVKGMHEKTIAELKRGL